MNLLLVGLNRFRLILNKISFPARPQKAVMDRAQPATPPTRKAGPCLPPALAASLQRYLAVLACLRYPPGRLFDTAANPAAFPLPSYTPIPRIFLGFSATAESTHVKRPACAGLALRSPEKNPPQPATGSNVLFALRWRLPDRNVKNDSSCGVSFRILFRDDLPSLRADRHLLRWCFSYHFFTS
jgi:hypothetical protein